MQLFKLIKAERVLESFSREKVDVTLSYKLMKFMKGCEKEQEFYDEGIRKIIEQYSEKDSEGKPIIINGNYKLDTNKRNEFDEEVAKLNETNVEAPTIKFTIGELKSFKVSVLDLISLEDFIIEEE